MPTSALFLDLDGTLVDSNARHVAAWRRAFADAGHDIAADAIAAQIGKGADQLVPALIPGIDEAGAQALGDAHGIIFKREHLARVEPLPGATDLVHRAHAAGCTVVLASSAGSEELRHYCDLLGIADLVDVTTTIDDVDASKPAPDIFAVAREKAGVKAAYVLVVGDSPFDMEAARRCGMRAVAVRTGGFPDDALRDAGASAILGDAAAVLAQWDEVVHPA